MSDKKPVQNTPERERERERVLGFQFCPGGATLYSKHLPAGEQTMVKLPKSVDVLFCPDKDHNLYTLVRNMFELMRKCSENKHS